MMRRLLLAVMATMSLSLMGQQFTMHATKYHPGMGGAGWRTASGDRIDNNKLRNYEIRWVALSSDMFRQHGFKLGDTIVVTSTSVPKLNGKWVVKDRMGTRRRQSIDFLLPKGDNYNFHTSKVTIEKAQ
ncbi:MAG: hypothetical protein IKR25_01720 [Muribaculaceae bacterium]|nr:hypothetical protein [Muribaculaceae bacterium]